MDQARLSSFYEALFNVFIGFWVSYILNLLVFPLYGFHITLGNNFTMGVIYTVVSIARQYIIRRWFNARLAAAARRWAGDKT